MTNQDFKDILKAMYDNLEPDGYGYWLPEWCILEGEDKPTFEEFVKVLKDRL